jgi:hypothetical protein
MDQGREIKETLSNGSGKRDAMDLGRVLNG